MMAYNITVFQLWSHKCSILQLHGLDIFVNKKSLDQSKHLVAFGYYMTDVPSKL